MDDNLKGVALNENSTQQAGCGEIGLKKTHLSVWTVFCMIFCMCAAGAYGLEDMISSSGSGMTLLILMILPFFWSIPII